MLVTCLVFAAAGAQAATLFKYTFDNRTAPGTETKRPFDSATTPYDGEDYVPDPLAGEFGPTLANPGPGTSSTRYRSFYSNDVPGQSDGREVLKLNIHHPHSQDRYRSVTGTGNMPLAGSFTWEMVVRIDRTLGATTGGRTNVVELMSTGTLENISTTGGTDLRGRGASLQAYNSDPAGTGTFDLGFWVRRNIWGHTVSPTVTGLNLGQYYHFAAVYDDDLGEVRLYVDGELAASQAGTMYQSGLKADYWLFGANGTDGTVSGTIAGYVDSVAASDTVLAPTRFVLHVPEPATMGLLLMAGGGLVGYLRRRRSVC